MPINWSIYNPRFGEQIGAAFDPNIIAEKQNALAEAAMSRQMKSMQLQQAAEQMQRLPIERQRADEAYRMQQADVLRKQQELANREKILEGAPEEMRLHFKMGGTPDTWAKLQEAKSSGQERRLTRLDELERRAEDQRLARQESFKQQEAMARLAAGLRPPPAEKMVAVMGNDGNPVLIPQSQAVGQQPWSKGGTTATKKQDAIEAMDLLRQAAPLIEKSTSSGLGNIADVSAGFFGASTEGANAAAQLKALGGALVAKMPKMSGPQSDKDVLLYKEMAGRIGDPTVPTSQKKAAMDTINEIQARYAGVEKTPLNFKPVQSSSGQIRRSSVIDQADAILQGR